MMNSSSDLQKDGMYDVAKKKTILAESYVYHLTLELCYGPGGARHDSKSVPGDNWAKVNSKLLTRHVMSRARALSSEVNNNKENGHCYNFAWI